MRTLSLLFILASLGSWSAPGQAPRLLNVRDQQAVEETVAGKRSLANAAWWGFNREDSTEALQAAINSGAKTLTIPFMGEPWIVRPLQLRSQQEILLEPGVLILEKKGEFQGGGDSLLTAVGQSNLVVRGYGATLRMHKRDYQNPPYTKAEWRMGIALRGCRHVLIEGLRVESTGGDGFYVDGGGDTGWSEDITIRNCTAYDNHRQGLSVISVVNLLVENCLFANTWGTAPEAGIDLEPDIEKNRLVNCVIRNCTFENNNGNEILVYLKPLTTNSEPVSIRFEHCLVRMTEARLKPPEPGPGINGVAGIAVGEVKDNGPKGLIEFIDCVTENTGKEGARVYDKSATSARVRFANCSFRNPWTSPALGDGGPRVPIILHLRRPESTENMGGIDFQDCYVYDSAVRPAVRLEEDKGDFGLRDVHGQIMVTGPGTPCLKLGTKLQDVDLKVLRATEPSR
ncbi:MAG: right-handed parallel beta-helix repeat-containing protein [Verrucomicrobia bacterium]|nr:right-handed parallel beta-helix repeat-containing protein [Verrucomicrobiota bacterium]